MAEQSGEHMQIEQGQCGPQPSITTAAQALDLNCKGLVDQVYDSVATLCAEGLGTVSRGVRELRVLEGGEEGPELALAPEVLDVLWQGIATLEDAHEARIEEQMAKFEAHVMQASVSLFTRGGKLGTCLHVPAGLVASAPPSTPSAQLAQQGAGAVTDEAQLEELTAQLNRIRAEIAEANQTARRTQREIKQYDEALKKYGDLSELQAVVGALAGKENAAEDAQAMVTVGAVLERECAGLEQVGRQRADRARGPPKDAAAAEKELLQLHPAAAGLTPSDLRAFQELLASQ
ncbi:hypothetical protein N2152v2_005360 [Parachlorella kessleri]